jgi:hypothetical protein
MNYRTPERRALLKTCGTWRRRLPEILQYENLHNDCKVIHADCTLEMQCHGRLTRCNVSRATSSPSWTDAELDGTA